MFHEGEVFIVKQKGSEFARTIDAVLNRMARSAEQFMAVRVNVGVSLPHKDFRQLAKAYEEAASALYTGRFGALSPVNHFGQAGERDSGFVRLRETDGKNLEYQLRFGSDEALFACISELKADAKKKAHKASGLNLYAVNLAGLLANYAASLGLDIDELTGGNLIDSLAHMHSRRNFSPGCYPFPLLYGSVERQPSLEHRGMFLRRPQRSCTGATQTPI
ncbi:hypothetical protein MASR2M48_06580 [Spirochaetota bacterium]